MRNFDELVGFKRLLVWLKATQFSQSRYGCIVLNSHSDIEDFLEHFRTIYGDIMVIDYSKDDDLIIHGHQFLTMENYRKKYGDEALLIINYLADEVDRFDEKKLMSQVYDINMNRENYVRYPSHVLLIFPTWFMNKIYRHDHDFVSMIGLYEDFTERPSRATFLKANCLNREVPSVSSLSLFRDSFYSDLRDIDRFKYGKKYLDICVYYGLTEDEHLKVIQDILSFMENSKDNEFIHEKKNEIYRLLCSSAFLKTHFSLETVGQQPDTLTENGKDIDEKIDKMRIKANEEELFDDIIEYLDDKIEKTDTVDKAFWYHNRACLFVDQGDYKMALKYFEKAKKIYEDFGIVQRPELAMIYLNMGISYDEFGEYTEALSCYQEAASMFEHTLGDHEYTRKAKMLEESLTKKGCHK